MSDQDDMINVTVMRCGSGEKDEVRLRESTRLTQQPLGPISSRWSLFALFSHRILVLNWKK
jgi:hypothetical protein